MHPLTLRVTLAQNSSPASRAERGASPAAFPRRAWERSVRERMVAVDLSLDLDLALVLAFYLDLSAPSRPEPLRQPVATSIGASINVDPRRAKACK